MKLKTFKEYIAEMAGTGPYIGSCKGGPDFQVWGDCSDQKKKKCKKKCKK